MDNSKTETNPNLLNLGNINKNVLEAQYPVRGELVIIAEQLQQDINEGKRKDLKKLSSVT